MITDVNDLIQRIECSEYVYKNLPDKYLEIKQKNHKPMEELRLLMNFICTHLKRNNPADMYENSQAGFDYTEEAHMVLCSYIEVMIQEREGYQ
jgi:hypothetical protein